MQLITFNPYRTIGIPNVDYIKPEMMFREMNSIKQADVLLFPEHWQLNALHYGVKKPVFPSPASIHLGHNKVEMTRALWTVCRENMPYTEIWSSTPEHIERVLDTFSLPFVAKEIKNSMGNGVFLIDSKRKFLDYAERNEVLYVQEYLSCDRDLRVCFVGDEVIGAYWRVGTPDDFRNNVAKGGTVLYDLIPDEAIQLVTRVAMELEINHAGFDILYSDGTPYILEFNTLFGNQGVVKMGVSIEDKIYQYLQSQFSPDYPRSPVTPFDRKRIS